MRVVACTSGLAADNDGSTTDKTLRDGYGDTAAKGTGDAKIHTTTNHFAKTRAKGWGAAVDRRSPDVVSFGEAMASEHANAANGLCPLHKHPMLDPSPRRACMRGRVTTIQ